MEKPKMYFPTMTDNEVISYAVVHAETDLEKALLERFESIIDELEKTVTKSQENCLNCGSPV